MERKKALVAAGALTLVLGSAVVASAAVGGGSVLGFGGTHQHGPGSFTATEQFAAATKPRVVHRTKNVYDKVVVPAAPPADGGSLGVTTDASIAAVPGSSLPVVTTPVAYAAPAMPSVAPPPVPTEPPSPPASGASPTPAAADAPPPHTTTVPATTPTTRPPGVPDDWPAGKPIPPMPPNCKQPQLEDNGVWNCQNSDD